MQLSEEQKKLYENTMFLKETINNISEDDILTEMPKAGTDDENDFSVFVTPDTGRNLSENGGYFKVTNSKNFLKGDKIARIMFTQPKYVNHKDNSGKEPWVLKSKEKKWLIALLNHYDEKNKCTVWVNLIKRFNEYVVERENNPKNNVKKLPLDLEIPNYMELRK